MSLSGIGRWLRNGLDDVGSVVTGQPAHAPAPPSPTQQPYRPITLTANAQPQGIQITPTKPTEIPLVNSQPQPQGINAPQLHRPNLLSQATNDLANVAHHTLGIASFGLSNAVAPVAQRFYHNIPNQVQNIANSAPTAVRVPLNIVNNMVVRPFASTGEHAALLGQGKNPYHGTNEQIASQLGNDALNIASVIPAGDALKGASTAAKYAKAARYGAIYGAGQGVTGSLAQGEKLPQIAKNTAIGAGLGAGLGLGGAGVAHGIDYVANHPLSGIADQQAAKHLSIKPEQIVNENEANMLRDEADRISGAKTGLTNKDIANTRAIANNIGLDIATGSPQDRVNRIYDYLGKRNKFISTRNGIAQGGYAQLGKEPENIQPRPSKGFIIKETKPHGGRQDVIRVKRNPETNKLETHQESIIEPKAASQIEQYAETFGVTKMQAEKDLKQMHAQEMDKKTWTPEELAKLSPDEKLSIKQKRELIQNDPNQQTINQVVLNPEQGSAKSAIANAMAVADERDARLAEAQRLGSKLSDEDKALLYRYDAGEKIDDLAKEANDPEAFSRAAHATADALDYSLAADRAAGAATLRQHNYIPHNYEVSEEWLNEHKIPEDQRIKIGDQVRGFRDIHAKYGSYKQAADEAGLKPLNAHPLEDVADYAKGGAFKTRNNALAAALAKAVPEHIAPIDTTYMNGERFRPAAGGNLPFAVSESLDRQLKGFRQAWSPDSKVGKVAENAVRLTGKATKKALFMGSAFHQAHIAENVSFASLLGGEPRVVAQGIIDEVKTSGGLSKTSYYKLMDNYRQDGTLDYARRMGIKFEGNSALGRFVDTYAVSLAKAAKRGGIEAGSQEAVDLGTIYNRLLGRENSFVEAHNPTLEKMTSYFALAPHYLRTQLRLVSDAFLPKKLGGAGYDSAFKLTTPGGAARSAVVGPRLFGALATITASAIIMHHFPTWQDAKNEAGLNPNNTNPNFKIKSKNSKGESQVMNIPTDPLGLAFGFITDPKHFFQSRYSPALSFGTKVATNQNWNGQPLADMSQPNAWRDRVVHAAENSTLPIGVQNFTNLQHNSNNPNAIQGTGQEFGLRLKTDPNDPQVKGNKQYFSALNKAQDDIRKGDFSAIDPSLSNVDAKYGADMAAKFKAYRDLSPGKDPTGTEYSQAWNALSSAQKASFMLMNDPKTGRQQLSPIFYVQQQLARQNPNRPHSPLYDLDGEGTGFTIDDKGNVVGSNSVPKAQIALDYAAQPATSDQKAIILAANPWLTDYEKASGEYSKNYVPIMTAYMQQQGWTKPAIDQYWQQHPNAPAPISPPVFSPQTQAIMNQYESITDPTQKAQFYEDNVAELSKAFTTSAIYKNQKAVAQGALPDQMYPTPNANAAAGLAMLQKNPNHDKGISSYNAQLIAANPDLKQYLADTGLYNLAKDAAQYQYMDPAHPGLNASALINLGRPNDQSTLKEISNVGAYDIGKNAAGQYSFMQNGTQPPGYSSGGGSSHKKIKYHKSYVKRVKMRRPAHVKKVYLKKPPSVIKIKNKAPQHVGIKRTTLL